MSEVLAVLRARNDAVPVTTTAAAVAKLLGATPRTLDLTDPEDRAGSEDRLLRELEHEDVLLAVLMGDGRRQVVPWRIARLATKPIVLVPRSELAPRRVISRVLIPLDGKSESSAAVSDMVAALARSGVKMLVLHVFEAGSVPRFWDHPEHAQDVWEAEFRARHCQAPGVRVEWRSGVPADRVIDVAGVENVDLIMLGWSRTDQPGRARTTRRTVREAQVPVLLIPILD